MESKVSKDTTIHLQVTFLEFKSPAILNFDPRSLTVTDKWA